MTMETENKDVKFERLISYIREWRNYYLFQREIVDDENSGYNEGRYRAYNRCLNICTKCNVLRSAIREIDDIKTIPSDEILRNLETNLFEIPSVLSYNQKFNLGYNRGIMDIKSEIIDILFNANYLE